MTQNLSSYVAKVDSARIRLKSYLASGQSNDINIAVMRRTLETMEQQLRESPAFVLMYDHLPPDPHSGLRGADLWFSRLLEQTYFVLAPETTDSYMNKRLEYIDYTTHLVTRYDAAQKAITDPDTGRSYLVQMSQYIPGILQTIAKELLIWFQKQEFNAIFSSLSPEAGLRLMLSERPDLVALLRLAQTLPYDTEISETPIQPSTIEVMVELAIGLVPVVGNVVASFEAYTGRDLFGYRLTNLDRGVLGACILLPLAGRLVKGGKALYTESRLMALYGRDARDWTRILSATRRASADEKFLETLKKAEASVRAQQKLEPQLATDAATLLSQLIRIGGGTSSTVDQRVIDFLKKMSVKYPILSNLDGYAMQRILEKGPVVDHLKGRLLEELIESRVVPWLQKRTGPASLGVTAQGKKLEFFPGHIIRDAKKGELTDGMIGFHNNGVLEIVAIFEAKAGQRGARELSSASGSFSSLTQEERLELRAYAKDVLEEEQELAQQKGIPFNRSLEEIEREIILTEKGGQIRRDIERLVADANGNLPQIYVGTQQIPVRFTPNKAKIFCVLPKDVNSANIERQLAAELIPNFEIIGVDIGASDLDTISKEMVPLATSLAEKR
ncbi:pre-toxin TG domain-containing protein [Bacillus sp. GB_SG_008]|uniref:pre-toxin TG domain-containing protein n=1 Tax=Bacillus sp. GB_SG_008 TaxID=3454627 RepID=UPI003F862736